METLTKRQKQIYEYVKSFIEENGFSPTGEEIRKHFKLSAVSGVHQHIKALIEKGFLEKNDNLARGIRLKTQDELITIPLAGTITAGQPIEAVEMHDEQIVISKNEISKSGKLYALRVEGNSMINDGVFDGDIVVIRHQKTADNGDTVVAVIDDNEATLKKIYKEKDRFRLQPANPSLSPIFRKEIEIRGIVVKIIRNLENEEEQENEQNSIFKMAELFCGPGGLAYGALLADVFNKEGKRFRVKSVWGNDIDEDSCRTYARNIHGGNISVVECAPVEKIDLKKTPSFDALTFGFPCNDFSVVGKQKGFKGRYGPLYTYGVKAINIHNPKWFMAENVSGIQSADEGMAFQKILEDLESAGRGYRLTTHLYKFEEYGVPQRRHRIVIIGIRKDLNMEFKVPAPTTPRKHVPVKKALKNPPIPKNAQNNEYTKQSDVVVERLKYIPPGENAWYNGIPERLRLNVKGAKMSQIYRRLRPDKPSYTITGSGGGGTHGYHWEENRALTNRERARIQTFPDDFIFEGSKESVRKQIGMAVPPKSAKIIIEAVLKTFAGVPYESISPKISNRKNNKKMGRKSAHAS